MMTGSMMGYYIIVGLIFLISSFVSNQLKSKFKKYSKIHLQNGLTGAQIAQKMLDDHGIRDVRVISTRGQLTDHYNPKDKTVNLSEAVYNEQNAAAAAVAAHEVGHAVQHATAYSWLGMRSKLVPMVSIASKYSQFVIIGGIALAASTQLGSTILLIGILMYATGTLFSLVTLPVEYDASKRALQWLEEKRMVTPQEHHGAKDALKWAARTYLVAAIGSLATLVYFISLYLRRR